MYCLSNDVLKVMTMLRVSETGSLIFHSTLFQINTLKSSGLDASHTLNMRKWRRVTVRYHTVNEWRYRHIRCSTKQFQVYRSYHEGLWIASANNNRVSSSMEVSGWEMARRRQWWGLNPLIHRSWERKKQYNKCLKGRNHGTEKWHKAAKVKAALCSFLPLGCWQWVTRLGRACQAGGEGHMSRPSLHVGRLARFNFRDQTVREEFKLQPCGLWRKNKERASKCSWSIQLPVRLPGFYLR